MDYPLRMSVLAFVVFWLTAHLGAYIRAKLFPIDEDERDDWIAVVTATLTLLGLIIGFSFSMAITRYDHRKNLEAEEANAIGTEYVRIDILPTPSAAEARRLLKRYVELRSLFYLTRDEAQLKQIDQEMGLLQSQLWAVIPPSVAANPSPPMALVMSGMNDVLNSSAYTTAAWLNRIPVAAWVLMVLIALCCNAFVGYCSHRTKGAVFLILPAVIALSFLLIADIDSPRGGVIHVTPVNLQALSNSIHAN